MNVEELLEAGIRSAESGDIRIAQKLFAQAVKIDPESDQAWLYLGYVLTDPAKKRDCFLRALQVNPQNPSAKRALEALTAPPHAQPALGVDRGGLGVGNDNDGVPPMGEAPGPPPRKKTTISIPFVAGIGAILLSVVFLCFLVFGRFIGLGDPLGDFIRSSQSGVPSGPAAKLPPIWTESPISQSPTPNPKTPTLKALTATSEPSPTLLYEHRLATAQPLIDVGVESNRTWDCLASIKAWSDVIEVLPEYGPAYYWRAFHAHCHIRAQGDISEYRSALHGMLEDNNLAISLDPDANGDYYALRFAIYSDLASTYELRADNDLLNALAVDDLEMALYLGASNPLLPRIYANVLAHIGRCDEAMVQANRLQDLILPGEAPSAGVLTMQAEAYVCKGQYWPALNAINSAINISDTEERRYTRAMIQFGLGRLERALADLDEIIEQDPTYNGYRYHLRALVHYDMGNIDTATADLVQGYFNTWGYGCAAALIEGLLGLQGDNLRDAAEYLKYAEATCPTQSRPVRDRVIRELEKLNLEPVEQVSSIELPPGPTAHLPPIDQSQPIQPLPPSRERTYDGGSGRLRLSKDGYITMVFSPRYPISFDRVLSLTFDLEPGLLPKEPNIDLYLYNPSERYWSMYPWEGGTIHVIHPERFIYPDGSLILSTYAYADEETAITNVAVNLELITDDGRRVNVQDVKPNTTPTPPAILAYATPIPYSISTPFMVSANEMVLLKLFPEPGIPEINFVIALTFQFSVNGQGQSTLDFSLWNPTSGGWGINQGNNKIIFGDSEIQIAIPDPYVARNGEIYLSLRNYGSNPVEITELSAVIEVRTVDGQIVLNGVAR